MKILAIRGENLASLAEPFDIDLADGPLGRAGLFAITGQTGSGKTTLLDALCVALFDSTPRLDKRGGPKVGRATRSVDDRLTANDVRGLLSRGKAAGFAEVDFLGIDGRRYRARWEVRRARNRIDGRMQGTEWSLQGLDSDELISGKKAEVSRGIVDRIGLSFEQFRRSALLAQGDFAAFLKAGEDERAELLERMTGTEIYSRLSIAAFEQQKAEWKRWKELEREVEALGVLGAEERADVEAARAEAAEARGQSEQALERARVAQAWWTRRDELAGAISDGEAAVVQATANASAGEQAARTLDRVRKAQRHRAEVEAVDKATRRIATTRQAALEAGDTQKTAESAAKRTALLASQGGNHVTVTERTKAEAEHSLKAGEKLDDELATLGSQLDAGSEAVREAKAAVRHTTKDVETADQALERTERTANEATAWLESHPHAEGLANNWDRLEPLLDKAGTVSGSLPELRSKAESAGALATERTAAATAATGDVRAAERVVNEAKTAWAAAKDAVPPMARAMAESSRDRAADSVQRAQQARQTLDAVAALRQARDNASSEAASQQAFQEQGQARLTEITTGLAILSTRLDEAKRAWDRAKAAASLQQRRAELTDGEPCPLCGATDHPWGPDGDEPPVVAAQHERVHALEREREALVESEAQLKRDLTVAETRHAEATRRLAESSEAAEPLLAQWREALTVHPELPDDPTSPDAAEAVQAWQDDAAEAHSKASAELTEIARLDGAATDARAAYDAAQEELATRRNQADNAVLSAQEASETATAAQATLDRETQALDHALTTVGPLLQHRDGWQEALVADPDSLRAELQTEAQQFTHHSAQLDKARRDLPGLSAKQASARSEARNAAKELERATALLNQLTQQHNQAKTQRAALFDGRSVLVVRAELAQAVAEARTAQKQAEDGANAAREALAAAEATHKQARKQLADALEDREQAAKKLAEVLLAANLDEDQLRQDLTRDPAWIAAEQDHLDAIREALTQATTRLSERREQLTQHDLTRPTDADREQATADFQAASQAHQQAIDGLARHTARLANDDEARANAAEAQVEIDAQHATYRRWKSLSDLIGSADGKRFRNFAQGLTLDVLLGHANEHLRSLAPRYRLERVPEVHLALQVIDQDMGDEVRSVNSLSGGESFLTSLALALGLSSLSAAQTRVDSLFIDEGFGTLDGETLELAFEALNALQATGRQVGIISHVDALTERVGAQVRVERMGAGRSRVVVAAAGS